jgi:hypothetical protein
LYIYWKRSWRVHNECEVSSASKRNFATAKAEQDCFGARDRLRPLSKFLNKLKISPQKMKKIK